MASDFDSSPKAIAAGPKGKEFYLFLLRRNAYDGGDGVVVASRPFSSHLLQRDADYIDEAIERAIGAKLIEVDGDTFTLIGWDEEWRPPLSSTERSKRFRERKKVGGRRATPGDAESRSGRKEKEKEKKNITSSPADFQPASDIPHTTESPSDSQPKSTRPPPFDFENPYLRWYPRKSGKAKGLAALKRSIKTFEDYQRYCDCLEFMARAWAAADTQFCPMFSTFANGKLWLDDEWPAPSGSGGAGGQSTRPSSRLL